MTTERIDHTAEAKRLMAEIEKMDPATQWMAMTQKSLLVTSHIGLAAVEQQRIDNLMTYLKLPMRVHGTESEAWPQINEGLGL